MLLQAPHAPQPTLDVIEDAQKVYGFCCYPCGVSKLSARFEQTAFTVDETARALLAIDNSECKADISEIKISLKAKVRILNTPSWGRSYNRTVASETFPGIKAKQKTAAGEEQEWRFLELNLKKFVTEFLTKYKRYMKLVQKTYGDYFVLPTTNTQLIRCNYFVVIQPEYDVATCMSCSGAPKITLPISLSTPGYCCCA